MLAAIKNWWQTKHPKHPKHPVVIFAIGYFILIALFYIGINTSFFKANIHPVMNNWYATAGSFIINIFGFATTVKQSIIQSGIFSLDIERGCDALEPIAFFSLAVLAYPASFKKKWQALLIGSIILIVLNIIRIVSLYFIGIYFKTAFEIMHVDVWQVVFILFTMALWIKWATSTK